MKEKEDSGYLDCPLCDSEIPMSGDEDIGEDIFCPSCESPLKLRKKKDDTRYLQEDF
ncbi:MAG: hypothetical protein V3W31_06880 [Thermodesulfobacteriota bacterium]